MNEAQRKQLGIRLSTARTHAGLNHRQVADKLKLDRAQTVGDWEAGTYGITLDNLLALAELYNASLDWLVGRAETPKVGATGGLINLAVERTVLAARTYAEAESAARRLDAIVPAGILFGYQVPSEVAVLDDEEWESRRGTIMLTLARLKRDPGKRQQAPPRRS